MHIKEGSLGSLSLPHLIMHSTERGVRVAPRVVAPGTPPLEPEDQSKIYVHPYGPCIPKFSLQWMKSPSRSIHVFRGPGPIKTRQLET